MSTNGKICIECAIELRPFKNGAYVVEMTTEGPMAIYSADIWYCPNCEWQGVGREPLHVGDPDKLSAEVSLLTERGEMVHRFWANQREKDTWQSRQ